MADNVIVIRGTLDYAKVIGAARPHTGNPKYDKGPYWSVDVTPNAESRELLKKFDITSKLREPNTKNPKEFRKESFLSLRVLENKSNGEKNKAPRIVNVKGEDWDDKLIGNGSVGDVKVRVVDYGKGVEKGVYLQAIRVLDHVPYEVESFAPISSDDEYFGKLEDMSDDVPFPFADAPVADTDLDDDVPY